MSDTIQIKDYLRVNNALYFAVISSRIESSRIMTMLRYIKQDERMVKMNTGEADEYIKKHHPEIIWHSTKMDCEIHGVSINSVEQIFKPQDTLQYLLHLEKADTKQKDAINLIKLLVDEGIDQSVLGITGSLMLKCQNMQSDIDLIVYDRSAFFRVREIIKRHIDSGELKELTKNDWHDAWLRRDCALTLDEYIFYEKRKFTKCLSGNTKVDITLLDSNHFDVNNETSYRKTGLYKIRAKAIDVECAYDFPAYVKIDHPDISDVYIFTATYIGQAERNEMIEVQGQLEENEAGNKRLIVGTSREAKDEYIRVIS